MLRGGLGLAGDSLNWGMLHSLPPSRDGQGLPSILSSSRRSLGDSGAPRFILGAEPLHRSRASLETPAMF